MHARNLESLVKDGGANFRLSTIGFLSSHLQEHRSFSATLSVSHFRSLFGRRGILSTHNIRMGRSIGLASWPDIPGISCWDYDTGSARPYQPAV